MRARAGGRAGGRARTHKVLFVDACAFVGVSWVYLSPVSTADAALHARFSLDGSVCVIPRVHMQDHAMHTPVDTL